MKILRDMLQANIKPFYSGDNKLTTSEVLVIVNEWLNQEFSFDSMEEAVYVQSFLGMLQRKMLDKPNSTEKEVATR